MNANVTSNLTITLASTINEVIDALNRPVALGVDAIVGIADAVLSNPNFPSVVADRIAIDEVGTHVAKIVSADHDTLAGIAEVVAERISESDLANEIDLDSLAEHFDADSIAEKVAEYIDGDDIAEKIGEGISASDVAENFSTSDIAAEIDVEEIAGHVSPIDVGQELMKNADAKHSLAIEVAGCVSEDVIAGLVADKMRENETIARLVAELMDRREQNRADLRRRNRWYRRAGRRVASFVRNLVRNWR